MTEGQDLSQVPLQRTELPVAAAGEVRRPRISVRGKPGHERPPRGAPGLRKKSLRERLRPVETETVPLVRRRPSSSSKRGAPVRRRRKSAWLKWLKPLTGAALIVGMPAALVVWLFTSPRFALQEMAVVIAGEGDEPRRVSEAWIRAELAPLEGENLLRLPLEEIAERLERHRWVRSVGLGKELPSRLQVRVIEKREVALLRAGDGLFYLDEEGRPIAPFEPTSAQVLRHDPLVVIDGDGAGEAAAALDLLRELEAVAPAWLAGLECIEVLREGDFKVHTTGLPFPLLLRAGAVEDSVRRLAEVLDQLAVRYGRDKIVDLRFDRRIIIEPSTGERAGETAHQAVPGTSAGGTTKKSER